jgi:anti-sigma factor RsiW
MPVPWRLNPDEFSEQPWVQAIARYQALYVRETVDLALDDVSRTRAVLAAFSARHGVPVVVPDLRDAGMTFRHIQRLAFNDAPVIQMVYLPATGRPFALCVVGANPSAARVITRRLEGLEVSTWGHRGLAYVMVADMPRNEAALLAERLASGRTPTLYTA